jgi:hypothetical protein
VVAYRSNGSAVTAVPNRGYHFVRWSDGLVRATRTDLAVCENLSIGAHFAVNRGKPTIARSPNKSKITVKRIRKVGRWTLGAAFRDRDSTPIAGARVYLQMSKNGKTRWTSTQYRLVANGSGQVSKSFSSRVKRTAYYRWYFPAANGYLRTYTATQKVTVK